MTEDDVHYLAILDEVECGNGCRISPFTNLYRCTLGDDVMIGPFVEIQEGAVIGDHCRISSHSFICTAVTLEADVFVGHGVMFCNDKFPRVGRREYRPVVVRQGASIGSGAVILPGVEIGARAMIGAGAVVTGYVPARAVVVGNPARSKWNR